MIADHGVDQPQAKKPAHRRQRNGEDNHKRVYEALEQRGHEQVRDNQREQKIPLQGLIGDCQIIGGPGEPDIVQPTQAAALLQRRDHVLADQRHGVFERHLNRRDDANHDRALPLDMIDLLGAGNQLDIRNGPHSRYPAAGCEDWHHLQILRARGIPIITAQGQINFITCQLKVTGLRSIHQHIDRKGQVPVRHLDVSRAIPLDRHLKFRASQIQAWHGTDLGATDERPDLSKDPPPEGNQGFQLRAGDFDIDASALRQPSLEQPPLCNDADHAGEVCRGSTEERQQLLYARPIVHPPAHKNLAAASHIKKVLDARSIERGFFNRTRLGFPMWAKHALDRAAQ